MQNIVEFFKCLSLFGRLSHWTVVMCLHVFVFFCFFCLTSRSWFLAVVCSPQNWVWVYARLCFSIPIQVDWMVLATDTHEDGQAFPHAVQTLSTWTSETPLCLKKKKFTCIFFCHRLQLEREFISGSSFLHSHTTTFSIFLSHTKLLL